MRGTYIVIEGAEGVGKTTQVKMLADALTALDIPVKVFREPDGESDRTTQVIRQITQDPSYPMNSRTEVLLYNAARSQSLEKISAAREAGFVCLVDRSYLTTLAVQYYGRGDITDYERLNQIIEFAVGNVKPDLTVVLDAPVDVLMTRKATTRETERFDQLDAPFLERIRSGYLWEARQRDLPIVYALGTADEVFDDIWRILTPILAIEATQQMASEPTSVAEIIESIQKTPINLTNPHKDPTAVDELLSKQNDANIDTLHEPPFYVPPELAHDERVQYTNVLSQIVTTHETLVRGLTQYLLDQAIASKPSIATARAAQVLRPLLPLAMLGEHHARPNIDKTIRSLAAKLLPINWASTNEPIQLIQSSPRNELDCVNDALFEYSELPMSDIAAMLRKVPYETKTQLFINLLESPQAEQILKRATYQWDLVTDYVTYEDFTKLVSASKAVLQCASPRLGFETPEIIEQAGLDDAYADCFDKSLALYSTLQAAGQEHAMQYTILLGHRFRWKITTTAQELSALNHIPDDAPVDTGCRTVIAAMLEKVAEAHPLISEALR